MNNNIEPLDFVERALTDYANTLQQAAGYAFALVANMQVAKLRQQIETLQSELAAARRANAVPQAVVDEE